jgi:hypothetical protein
MEAEKRLREIMNVNMAVILVIDSESNQFFKLNPDSIYITSDNEN